MLDGFNYSSSEVIRGKKHFGSGSSQPKYKFLPSIEKLGRPSKLVEGAHKIVQNEGFDLIQIRSQSLILTRRSKEPQ